MFSELRTIRASLVPPKSGSNSTRKTVSISGIDIVTSRSIGGEPAGGASQNVRHQRVLGNPKTDRCETMPYLTFSQ
jgi:hypothetical protein